MKQPIAYEDAVDVLDADHKAVKQLFIQYNALCEDNAPPDRKGGIATRICAALTLHAQIEEEIFYPAVREALGDDALMDEALEEHAEANNLIAKIEAMRPGDAAYDATLQKLAKLIDQHVLEEREQIFLRARRAPMDLRGLALPLLKRKQQLTRKTAARVKEAA